MARIDRVNQTMKREVADVIRKEVKDPRLGFVTITHVDVSRDLQHAKVYFSVLGNDQQSQEVQKGLDSAKGYIRRLIGQRVRMRYTPELNFIQDRSIEQSFHIEETLERFKGEGNREDQGL